MIMFGSDAVNGSADTPSWEGMFMASLERTSA